MMNPDDLFDDPIPPELRRAKRLRGIPCDPRVQVYALDGGCVLFVLPRRRSKARPRPKRK